ncbi:MAG: hypothetical protein GYA23_07325 [Methanomicrobiales archaeon]|nr:hypothetical protein [Methanomicrobiales archaeon]
MVVETFRESLRLLGRMPILWIPGIICGLVAAALFILFNTAGAFFTSRIMILSGLVVLIFIIGMIALIRDGTGDIRDLVRQGIHYYFRVLLPLLVICFTLLVIFILLIVTFGFLGSTPDPGTIGVLTFCVMIPTLMLSFFFDMAAVYEDRKVFESIQRSIVLVSENAFEVIGFFVISALAGFSVFFGLMIVWEALLLEKLEPLATLYEQNQTAFQELTPGQFMGMIGTDGMWLTAVVIFLGFLILVPLLVSYKATFYRKLVGGTGETRQMTGEYDSKGRWYKY